MATALQNQAPFTYPLNLIGNSQPNISSSVPSISVAPNTAIAPKPIYPPTKPSPITIPQTVNPAPTTNSGIDMDPSSPTFGMLSKASSISTPKVPPAEAQAPVPTSASTPVNGMNGSDQQYINGNSQNGPNPAYVPPSSTNPVTDTYNKYGLTPPTAPNTAPVTLSDYTQSPNYQSDMASIDQQFQATKGAIAQKYANLNQQASLDTENERKSNTSGLYRMGETNPMSSSVSSIQNLSDKNLTIRQANLAAAQGEENANAANQAFNMGQTVKTNAQNWAVQQEQAIQANNAKLQQDFENNWSQIDNSMNLVKAGQTLNFTEQDQNFDRITKMLTQFGSSAFNGVAADQLDSIAKAAGMSAGTLQSGLQTMKEKELYGKLNLRQLMDGSLVNVSIGKDGKPVEEVLFPPQTGKIVDGIMNGTIPPDITGYGSGVKTAVTESLAEKGFDISSAVQAWDATKKQLSTLNNNQQTSLRQSISTVTDQVKSLDSYNKTAEDAMTRSGITNFATVQRKAAESGAFGQEVKNAFLSLDGQIAEIVPELSKIYSGNGVGTDAKMSEAMKQLSSDWDYQTMKDQIDRVYQNLNFRTNAMNNTSVAGVGNAYVPVGGATAPIQDVTQVDWASIL